MKEWTAIKETHLRDLYSRAPWAELEDTLGMPAQTIQEHARALGLRRHYSADHAPLQTGVAQPPRHNIFASRPYTCPELRVAPSRVGAADAYKLPSVVGKERVKPTGALA